MLTDKQKKLLQRAVIYPTIVITGMVLSFTIPFLWLFLFMIDDLVLESQEFFVVGLYALFILVFIILAILFVLGIYIQRAVRKKEWIEMADMAKLKLEGSDGISLLEKAANIGLAMTPLNFTSPAGMIAEVRLYKRMKAIRNAAMQMGVLFREKIPNRITYTFVFVLIPVVLLLGLFGFRYIDSIQTNRGDAQSTAKVVDHIEDVFETTCTDLYVQDPLAQFDRNGYTISGDLYEEGKISYKSSQIEIRVNNEGQIQSVDYRLGVNVQDTKENNLTRMEQELEQLYDLLMETDVEMTSESLKAKPYFPQEMIDAFMDHSYYEDISGEAEKDFYVGYITSEEENYELYGETYFYFMMD